MSFQHSKISNIQRFLDVKSLLHFLIISSRLIDCTTNSLASLCRGKEHVTIPSQYISLIKSFLKILPLVQSFNTLLNTFSWDSLTLLNSFPWILPLLRHPIEYSLEYFFLHIPPLICTMTFISWKRNHDLGPLQATITFAFTHKCFK